jgi:Phage tail sheath protein FI
LVDNTRGVWNAPANVSINNVISPVIQINNNEQAELNAPIDGKSINAIRSFTGKGVLVWGARSLDGNSTDWRYIPVRRTCIMIETAVAAALQQFIFEPNDANTWINIQALIENYLTELWKQGALQGAKPEHAFAVQIGLGKTMTNTDLLEGMLRVQIMISVVRPAEFLVLSFQQKMAV